VDGSVDGVGADIDGVFGVELHSCSGFFFGNFFGFVMVSGRSAQNFSASTRVLKPR
jgi:hypothetical protein